MKKLHQRDVRGADIGARAASDAVEQTQIDRGIEASGANIGRHFQRHQTAGAGVHTMGATDAGHLRRCVNLVGCQRQEGIAALDRRDTRAGQWLPHHRAAADQSGRILFETATKRDQVRERCAEWDTKVTRLFDSSAGHRHHAGNQRVSKAQGVMDRQGGGHVVDDDTDIGGKPAGRSLLAAQDLHQMFLGTRGIARWQADDLHLGMALGGAAHGRLCQRLIVLDGKQHPLHTQGARHQQGAVEHSVRLFAHQPVVAGEVGLALGAVDHQGMQAITLAQVKLDRGRKGCPAHPDDTGFGNPPGNLFRLQGKGFDPRLDGVDPLILAIGFQGDGSD